MKPSLVIRLAIIVGGITALSGSFSQAQGVTTGHSAAAAFIFAIPTATFWNSQPGIVVGVLG